MKFTFNSFTKTQLRFIFFLLIISAIGRSQNQTVGLLLNDSESFPGYTLFTPKQGHDTYLIDNNGMLVHRWFSDQNPASTVYLLENGQLLRSTRIPTEDGSGGFRVHNWDGSVDWEYSFGPQHHDIEPLPNGNVLLITNDVRTFEESITAGRDSLLLNDEIRSLKILEIAPSDTGGTIVWEWILWDHLVQEFDSTNNNYGNVSEHPELINLNYAKNDDANWVHINSIAYHPGLDQIMISSRKFNELWIIDHSTTLAEAQGHGGGNSGKGGDILYRWGNPRAYQRGDSTNQKLFAQHDASWIMGGLDGAGNILVFNNGLGRPDGVYSSVVEFKSPVDAEGNYEIETGLSFGPDTLSWFYIAETPEDFYASRFSGAQRLPNGNTLICEGVGGNIFEVTQAKKLVWKYVNPINPDGIIEQGTIPTQNSVFRAYRYGWDYSGFDGKSLFPLGPLDAVLAVADDRRGSMPEKFSLNQNYPNPFNGYTTISFNLTELGEVVLNIYDIIGQQVNQINYHPLNTGLNSVTWNGTNQQGYPVSSGMYLYIVQGQGFKGTRKMLYLK